MSDSKIEDKYSSYLDWIDEQKEDMVGLTKLWGNIPSGSKSYHGLEQMRLSIKNAFSEILPVFEWITLPDFEEIGPDGKLQSIPVGLGFHMYERANAPIQVLLSGHMDTVFPDESAFKEVEEVGENKLKGPGIVDMKGGLVVMWAALQAFERYPFKEKIGWQVFISPDEEIGSPSSGDKLRELAETCQLGLIFEPSSDDGYHINERGGSCTLSVSIKGKAAHVGRHFQEGRHAIYGLARIIQELHELNKNDELIINVGSINGGGLVNVVPDQAFCKINIRFTHKMDHKDIQRKLEALIHTQCKKLGLEYKVCLERLRPPKPFDTKNIKLFEAVKSTAKELGIEMKWKKSGGVCDGNILSDAGIPCFDTLGVKGSGIHSDKETLEIDSLVERAKLTALFLMKLASGEGYKP